MTAAQSIRSAILKMEQTNPGFCYEFIMSVMMRTELNININEAVLRQQGNILDSDCKSNDSLEYIVNDLIMMIFFSLLSVNEYRLTRTEEPFQELNRKSVALKVILSRIPDEITDRKTFLETIK